MDSARWQIIETLVQGALKLPDDERTAWIDANSAGDESVRAEVISLLKFENTADPFLDKSVAVQASRLLIDENGFGREGQHIGPYRVLTEIGQGGMGIVYLAEREDEQFDQRVAIKLVKRGLDTDHVLRRFRNERQILASLEHPHIARLIDGGTTADGLPFFVLEYVEGEPLDRYCDEHKLPTNQRLQLFRTICAVVQYAHQNLIVHRDLKPSNILITATGEPKLLDFGIAKVLDPEIGVSGADLTRTGLRLLTPDYASPEQVRGEKLTTASDVYSLGVILYELLTGHRPYPAYEAASYDLARVVCEQEPAKPSTAINQLEVVAPGDTRSRKTITPEAVSSARDTQPDKLRRRLAGDLDNIVLMAMRKEPTRRYKSVEQFSEDIERHLNGLPVLARPATFRYRASKFIQRNRISVAAASLILLSLIGGIVATGWQARRARQEQAKAEEIKVFLERTLNYSNPIMSGKNSETTVAEVLDDAARRLESGEFSNQPEIKAELELIISKSYYGQGKRQLAAKHLQESISLQRQLYGDHHPKTLIALSYRALLLFSAGEMAEAENIYREILPSFRDEQKKGNIKAESLAAALNNFAYLRRTRGDSKEAEALFREALALSPQMSPDEWRFTNGVTRSTLASTLADLARFEDALQVSRDAVAEYRQRGETDTPNFGYTLTVLGGFLADKGNFGEADASLRDAERIFRKLLAPICSVARRQSSQPIHLVIPTREVFRSIRQS